MSIERMLVESKLVQDYNLMHITFDREHCKDNLRGRFENPRYKNSAKLWNNSSLVPKLITSSYSQVSM